MRKISRTLALMGLLAPLGANALGIGDIRLHSALNQSLDAEIPLVLSGSDDLSELRVTLATAEAFAKVGIERHYSLSKLRFTPQQKADGSYVIKVSSQETIREPILDFMIEVHWPQGRLQREFTVLLDPPPSFRESEGAEADLAETESYQRPPEQAVQRPAQPSPEKPRRLAKESQQIEAVPQAPAEEVSITGTQYGPVGKNETLWSIAKRFNQNGAVSQEKMLQALYKANPQAFYKHSVNALKAGETITIPDRESIARLGALSAPQTVRGAGRLAAKPATGGATGEAGLQGQLKLLAPSASKSKDETAGIGGKGRAGKPSEETERAVADSFKLELEEIRKRIAELEQQNSEMQRQLSLKNEQLATLQAQQKQAAKQPPTAIPPLTPTQAPVPTMPPPGVDAAKPPIAATQPPPTTPVPPPAQQAQPPQAQPPVVAPTKPVEAPVITPPSQPVPPPAQVKKPVTPPAKPPVAPAKEEEGLLAKLWNQPAYMFIGELSLLALSGVAVMQWYKRRRAEMIDDTESILTLSDREKTVQATKRVPTQLDHTSGISETPTTARSSFLSEFTPSDFDALGGEMEEVDPISEADVYLAYGRYKQAEELIRSAITQNPERDECKLKLLEIHYATENAQAFEKFAQELEPTHRTAKPEFWEKVAEMGQELCPGSSLFGTGGIAAAAPASAKKAPSAAHEMDFGLEEELQAFHREERPAEDKRQPTQAEDKAQADLTQDFFYTEATTRHEADKTVASAEPVDDFQRLANDDTAIPSYNSAEATTRASAAKEVHDKTLDDILAELGVLSEESSLAETSSPAAAVDEEAPAKESNSIEFEAGGFERMLEAEKAAQHVEYVEEETIQYGGETEFRYGEATADEESPQYGDDDSPYLALAEMDEQETKLDLAKAYFDMGDDEAARVILEGVAENGNDAQKQEAWSLLNRITRKEVNSR